MMQPVEVITQLWDRISNRDWDGLTELLAADVVLELPASSERIVGRDNVVAVNAEYPDGWTIQVQQILGHGDTVVSEVRVPLLGRATFVASSFWVVRDGLVRSGREYWVQLGGDPAPQWRAQYTEPVEHSVPAEPLTAAPSEAEDRSATG